MKLLFKLASSGLYNLPKVKWKILSINDFNETVFMSDESQNENLNSRFIYHCWNISSIKLLDYRSQICKMWSEVIKLSYTLETA